jgi:hypothetical protein
MLKLPKKQEKLFKNVFLNLYLLSQASKDFDQASILLIFHDSYLSFRACEKCRNDKRKTINGDDLLFALNQLGFDRYLENLNLYYTKYKEVRFIHASLKSPFRLLKPMIKIKLIRTMRS